METHYTCKLVGQVEEVWPHLHHHLLGLTGLGQLLDCGNERVGHCLCAKWLP